MARPPQRFYSFPPDQPSVTVSVLDLRNADRAEPVRTQSRRDGWPLCPFCGEDEAYSTLMLGWNGKGERPTLEQCLAAPFRCYCHPRIEFTVKELP